MLGVFAALPFSGWGWRGLAFGWSLLVYQSRAGFQVHCTDGIKSYAEATLQVSNDRFIGTVRMNMGGKNTTVIERQIGKRVGHCAW